MKPDPPRIVRFGVAGEPSGTSSDGALPDVPEDPGLTELLQEWRVPEPADSLDIRVLEDYRDAIATRRSSSKTGNTSEAGVWPGRSRRWMRWLAACAVLTAATAAYVAWGDRHPLSAAELLKEAVVAEGDVFGDRAAVTHRVLRYEARRLADDVLVSRGRVEVWQDAARRVQARRFYDQRGRLAAGAWRREGTSTLYQPGRSPAPVGEPVSSAGSLWAWGATAEDFERLLVGRPLSVSERSTDFVLRAGPDKVGGVTGATLTIAKMSRRSMSATLRVMNEGAEYEHRWSESALERIPSSAIPPNQFEPDAALLPAIDLPPPAAAGNPPPAPADLTGGSRIDRSALDRLEIDAWHALNRLGLTLGDEAWVDRLKPGHVDVRVAIAGDLRRAMVERSLAELGVRPAVRVDIRDTPAEPAAANAISADAQGLDALTRAVLEASPSMPDETARGTARQIAAWAVERARVVRTRADSLEWFTTRWPPAALERLDLDSVAKWQQIVRQHVFDVGQEVEQLHARLVPLAGRRRSDPDAKPPAVMGWADIGATLPRVVHLSRRVDDLVRGAFVERQSRPEVFGADEFEQVFAELQGEVMRLTGPWSLEKK